ncbi:hypothetical protein IJM16_00185, partial [Candidatus Saccharibacteria bacterium]|nr:hypothetical protein [Candidatus Saccharibacteria bacterium]
MAGEIPPKNPTENPSASAWDMEPHTEVKDAEYYRSHPGEINVFVADLIRLRGGAASIKEGATWDKVQRTHVDKDGIPRDWAHLTGYLKRNPDQIDRFLEEYKSLGGGNEGAPVEQEASAAQGGEEENRQPEPTSEQPAAPETQPEPTSEQPSTPEATNETSETNETNEAEMTHEQLVAAVKKFLGTEVFDASDHLGIDLHDDVFSFKDLPDGDIQRILDELNRMHGEGGAAANAGGNGEGEKVTETLIDGVKLPVPTPEPIIKSNNEGNNGGTSAAEGGNGGSGDNNGGDNGGDRNNGKNGGESGAENKEEERKRTIGRRMLDFLSRNRARIITVAALTTILTTMGLFGPKQVDTLDDDRSNTAGEDYDGEHNLESMESQWIIDGYGEQGMWLSETKAGPTCFADAVEVNKALGETDNARLMVCYTAANQSESFADYMTAMPDDMRPEALRGITNIVEMEKAIETKLSKDEYMNARKTFDFYLQYAEEEDVYLDGDYENAYMKLLDEGSDVTHENMELVRCVTHEHHTHAKRIIFKDKDGNVIGEFIVKANTDLEQGKTGCMQVVRPVGSSAFEGMDPGPENPEQDPEEPEDDDDDDDDHHDDDDHEDDDDDDDDDH